MPVTLFHPERMAIRLAAAAGLDAQVARRLFRFLVMGIASAGSYVAVMHLAVVGLGLSATASSIIAFFAGGLVSYIGNTLWGFGAVVTPATASRFLLVILVTLGINTALAWIMELLGIHHLIIGLVSVVVVAACNFIGHSVFTYREPGAGT
jgi:putative flippase GtrA